MKRSDKFCPRCEKDKVRLSDCCRQTKEQCKVVYHCDGCGSDYIFHYKNKNKCKTCLVGRG